MIALGFVFIPVYLRFLGIEAYGLVGFFAALQAVFGLLDLGLGTTINREMARLGALGRRTEQCNLQRRLGFVNWGVSLAIGFVVILLAPVIATRWVNPEDLSSGSIADAIRLMGVVIALQFPWGFYQGGLMGLGGQVFVNAAMIVTGTID